MNDQAENEQTNDHWVPPTEDDYRVREESTPILRYILALIILGGIGALAIWVSSIALNGDRIVASTNSENKVEEGNDDSRQVAPRSADDETPPWHIHRRREVVPRCR